jgi:DNA sulfur modification protein DndB
MDTFVDAMNEISQPRTSDTVASLPFDPGEGTPVPMLEVDDNTAVITITVAHLLQVVPDPVAAEKADRVAEDARLRAYGELRSEVQRLVEGAKKKNAVQYGNYLVEGYRGEHPWVTPPITLFHEGLLKTVEFGGGSRALLLPHGAFLTAIDGETQRLAWSQATQEEPGLLGRRIAAIVHHGRPVRFARQFFHDLNTLEVKPNAAVAISMDERDPATQIARSVMEEVPQLQGRINLRRRQLRRRDPEVLTISGLRTGIVTTILGEAGLQIGSRPISLPDGVSVEDVEKSVVSLWTAIVEQLEDELEPERRSEVVVSAPSILAGLGVLAHQAMPTPPREGDGRWTIEEVLDCLTDINWEREREDPNGETKSVWDGIAGKFTPSGRFSIGGPKEVGHTVAIALKDPKSPAGQKIRS